MTPLLAPRAGQKTGVHAYDVAHYSGVEPVTSNIFAGQGMSSVWQRDLISREPVSHISVPANASIVLLCRTSGPYIQRARLAGTAYNVEVKPNFFMLLPSGIDSIWFDQTERVQGWFHLHFDKTIQDRIAAELGWNFTRITTCVSVELRKLADTAIHLSGNVAPPALIWDSLCWMILYHFSRCNTASGQVDVRLGHHLAPWQARRAVEFMRANLDRDITLNDISGICHVSPYHFARGFKNSLGRPPYQYLMLLRMERARDLLLSSTMSVTQIALSVGYDTPQAFARAFRRIHGISPSHFRIDRANCPRGIWLPKQMC